MAVLKTTSPERSMGAPKLLPSKTVPSSRARIAEFKLGFASVGVDNFYFTKVSTPPRRLLHREVNSGDGRGFASCRRDDELVAARCGSRDRHGDLIQPERAGIEARSDNCRGHAADQDAGRIGGV